MKTIIAFVLILSTGGVLAVATHASGRSTQSGTAQPADAAAVGLVRNINNGELESKLGATHRYVSLAELLQSPRFADVTPKIQSADAVTGTFGADKVYVIASPAGDHYEAGVIPARCGTAFFTTDAGVIYPAKALDCDEK